MRRLNTLMKTLNRNLKIYSRGFTAIELMIVLVIVGIVVTVALPSLKGTVQNGRLTSQLNHMVGVLAFARNEAAKRPNTNITVCATKNPNSSTPSCNTDNWELSYIMFTDADGDRVVDNINEDLNGDGVLDIGEDINGNGVLDTAVDQLLQVGRVLEGYNTLRTRGFPNPEFIQFDATGTPNSSGTFMLCDDRGTKSAKAIVVSVIGHIRVAVDDNRANAASAGDGIVNDHAGVNISCP